MACQAWDGRMGDVALWVASLGGFEPGDPEHGSQRDAGTNTRHAQGTTQDAAKHVCFFRARTCNKVPRRE